ncbi:MAG: phosphoribosyltransferase [Desulfuromonadales bacterium]|nr:phosphoribosyltransferase [Desulfuromonadales bacterium]
MDRYKSRKHAGELLAEQLMAFREEKDVIVLGLPRGGVPVAEQVALALRAPLGIFLVRKVGLPGQKEVAMGAIGSGGVQVINERVMRAAGVSREEFEAAAAEEQKSLREREKAYSGEQADLDLAGKTVILVDDGVATGSTVRVAIKALLQHDLKKLIVAIPVAPPEVCKELAAEVDNLICPLQPIRFAAVSQWYEDFGQTSDDEVRDILRRT